MVTLRGEFFASRKVKKTLKREHKIIKKKDLELCDFQLCINYVGGEVNWNKIRCMKSCKVGKLLNN